jgi:hypothetical protein
VEGLSTTEGLVALIAGGVALVALVLSIVLAVRLRHLRADQRTVLGEAGERDLVEQAARLERAFLELRDWVEESGSRIDSRMAGAERRLDGSVTHRSLVRYDAYGEMSGHQSSSVALLDSTQSGLVLSSILHRENARVYVKRIVRGESDLELSPEERQAIEAALASDDSQPADS